MIGPKALKGRNIVAYGLHDHSYFALTGLGFHG
jgi:hypothetical protein